MAINGFKCHDACARLRLVTSPSPPGHAARLRGASSSTPSTKVLTRRMFLRPQSAQEALKSDLLHFTKEAQRSDFEPPEVQSVLETFDFHAMKETIWGNGGF